MTTPSTEQPGDAATATMTSDDRLREHTMARNAARDALREVQQQQQAPRLRAQAKAQQAAQVTVEALGVHDKLPDFPAFNHFALERNAVATAIKGTFESMARVFDSPQVDTAQSISQVAKLGRDKLEWASRQIAAMRGNLWEAQQDVERRTQAAMLPPGHLAGVVASARDALRSMNEDDRARLLSSARGDTATVLMYAVGGAPGFLSGVPEGKHVEMRRMLLGVRDPDLLTLEPAIPQAFAALKKMEDGISRLIGSVADFDAAKALAELRS